MFNVKWDPECNGVLLTTEDGDVNTPVRPVFFEELDLLGFPSLGFAYPRTEAPLLWAAGRVYFYRGEKVATVVGGGFYHDVRVEIETKQRTFEPVDLNQVKERNYTNLIILCHDAIDFIRATVKQYRQEIDVIAVSFSGGKDSIVIADLVRRSLGSDDFYLIFADTSLESPFTYKFVEKYRHETPGSKFLVTKLPRSQIELWHQMGSPSRIHRWCHTVYKTAPIRKAIKQIVKSENPTILLVDGIRAEESSRRSTYDNLNFGTKDMLQTNMSPILRWSSLEVFLYLFSQNIPFNKMYRYGYARVGCIICPYSSGWGEYLTAHLFPDEIEQYLQYLREAAENGSIEDISKYINDGEWKKRSGGLDLDQGGNRVTFAHNKDDDAFDIYLNNSDTSFWTWIKILGSMVKTKEIGALDYNGANVRIEIKKRNIGRLLSVKGIGRDIPLLNLIKKAAYKSEYCVLCGACEAVCPTGALKILDSINIDYQKCNRCHICFNHVEKGCWTAKSISYVGFSKVRSMNGKGMNRYQGFGLELEWISYFFKGNDWLVEGEPLGNRKIMAMKNWLKDAGFWDGNPTELGKVFMNIADHEDRFMWAVIWNNLAEVSPLINWYCMSIPNGVYTKSQLIDLLSLFRNQTEPNRTDKNSIDSLINLLTKSPIGKAFNQGFEIQKIKGIDRQFSRLSANNLNDETILYSIVRYAERVGRKKLVASEFINTREISPYWVFKLEYNDIKDVIVRLANAYPKNIQIEFSGNLDNVTISENTTSLEIVKLYADKKTRIGFQ